MRLLLILLSIILLATGICISAKSVAAEWKCTGKWPGTGCRVWKLETPHGWLVGGTDYSDNAWTLVYIPDAEHEWRGD